MDLILLLIFIIWLLSQCSYLKYWNKSIEILEGIWRYLHFDWILLNPFFDNLDNLILSYIIGFWLTVILSFYLGIKFQKWIKGEEE